MSVHRCSTIIARSPATTSSRMVSRHSGSRPDLTRRWSSATQSAGLIPFGMAMELATRNAWPSGEESTSSPGTSDPGLNCLKLVHVPPYSATSHPGGALRWYECRSDSNEVGDGGDWTSVARGVSGWRGPAVSSAVQEISVKASAVRSAATRVLGEVSISSPFACGVARLGADPQERAKPPRSTRAGPPRLRAGGIRTTRWRNCRDAVEPDDTAVGYLDQAGRGCAGSPTRPLHLRRGHSVSATASRPVSSSTDTAAAQSQKAVNGTKARVQIARARPAGPQRPGPGLPVHVQLAHRRWCRQGRRVRRLVDRHPDHMRCSDR